MKAKLFIAANVFFVVLLLVIYFLHIKLFDVNVIFYAAIADGIIAALLMYASLFMPWFRALTGYERFLMLFVWLLLGYSFAISVPTVIDRSLSFYILEKLSQRGGGIRQDAMQDVFVKEYMVEDRLIDVRLTEQLQSGTIVIRNGCVKLTEKGRLISDVSRYFRENLLPKRRLLMGKYTDVLTDPFRHSPEQVNYRCQ